MVRKMLVLSIAFSVTSLPPELSGVQNTHATSCKDFPHIQIRNKYISGGHSNTHQIATETHANVETIGQFQT